MKTITTPGKYTGSLLLVLLLTLPLAKAFTQTSHAVSVASNRYTPKEIIIEAGDEVVWTCNSGHHNVNGDKSVFPNNPQSFGNMLGANWVYRFTFSQPGTYDYQCDPHTGVGMFGKIIVVPVSEPDKITLAFRNMGPHLGQTLWLSVRESIGKREVHRERAVVMDNFDIAIEGVEPGKSYDLDFFADHNRNGFYDLPPVDHAWRITTGALSAGNNSVEFTHNTDFSDIEWRYRIEAGFSAMDPHIGQSFTMYLKDATTGAYLDTVSLESIESSSFVLIAELSGSVVGYATLPGMSLHVDFYADHNGNGLYDAPPSDHAWRLVIDAFQGDTVFAFVHNMDFTDIFGGASGFETTTMAPEIILYPNPVSDRVIIALPAKLLSPARMSISSLNGQVFSELHWAGGNQTFEIDVKHLAPGIYLLAIETGFYRGVERFVKY